MTQQRHRWSDPERPDIYHTRRVCLHNCGLVKVTRHEPDNNPPHWVQFEHNGAVIRTAKTPPCDRQLIEGMPF
jgi:hypothetical protein